MFFVFVQMINVTLHHLLLVHDGFEFRSVCVCARACVCVCACMGVYVRLSMRAYVCVCVRNAFLTAFYGI